MPVSHNEIMVRVIQTLLLLAVFAVWPSLSTAAEDAADLDLKALTAKHERALSSVTSDEAAAKLFQQTLLPTLGLPPFPLESVRTHGRSAALTRPAPLPQEFLDTGTSLTMEIAAWRLAQDFMQAAGDADRTALGTILQATEAQRAWLTNEARRPPLLATIRLSEAAVLFPTAPKGSAPPWQEDYEAYLSSAVPKMAGREGSWIDLAVRRGAGAVQDQLLSFPGQPNTDAADKEALLAAAASRYFHERLQPLFLAHATAMATKAHYEAERRIRAQWRELTHWPDRLRQTRGAARLCGTWNWTIHNHQNHLDHKTVMVFPNPHAAPTEGLRPTNMVVLGDVVYLRWEIQGAVQEDSLLFTSDGRRLEGSFVNSSGAWGSITGKRVGSCPR